MRNVLRMTSSMAAVAMLAPALTLAHGSDKPGPHGGEIRMPGAYHVEAVALGDSLMVYLLDMRFENPTTRNSAVEVRLHQQGEARKLACEARVDAFRCPLPGKTQLGQGRLEIVSRRGDNPPARASYELPLTPAAAGA